MVFNKSNFITILSVHRERKAFSAKYSPIALTICAQIQPFAAPSPLAIFAIIPSRSVSYKQGPLAFSISLIADRKFTVLPFVSFEIWRPLLGADDDLCANQRLRLLTSPPAEPLSSISLSVRTRSSSTPFLSINDAVQLSLTSDGQGSKRTCPCTDFIRVCPV